MSITRLTTNGLTGTKYDTVSADNYYMEPIATTLVGAGGSASVTFSNIPQGYKHLQVRTLGRSTNSTSTTAYSAELLIQFNGDTGSNYNAHAIEANGASVSAQYQTTLTLVDLGGPFSGQTANAFGVSIIDILDYSNVYKFKTVRALGGQDLNGYGTILFGSGLWRNTAAITSIKMTSGAANWAQYSRISLYGIKG